VNKKLLLACFSVLIMALLWSQQTTGQNKDFTIGVEVNMVNVPITLRNPKGDFLKGLPQSAFQIYEDGEVQDIELFTQEAVPARIAVVLDISGSVLGEWGSIKFATKKFLEHLAEDDEFSLITFNTEIRKKMNWGRKTDRVEAVLGSIYCKGNTNLWDAIWVVSNDVFKGIKEKKAMIIMSDGLDNNSSEEFESALQAAVRSEAAIYVVSKTEAVRQLAESYYKNVDQRQFVAADSTLRKLAYETGGRVLYPNSFGELDNVYAQVDEELKNQYSIGYVSTNALKDGSYRKIKVVVAAPGAQILARPGYYAPDELHKKR
jgi:Ca-activated chloride channel homolog